MKNAENINRNRISIANDDALQKLWLTPALLVAYKCLTSDAQLITYNLEFLIYSTILQWQNVKIALGSKETVIT